MVKTLQSVLLVCAFGIAAVAHAQQATTPGKIAVLDQEGAIFATEEAQKRIKALNANPEFDSGKKEYEKLGKEYEAMVKQFQKDAAVMSADQQEAQRKKLGEKSSDLEHIGRKLQAMRQDVLQNLMQEMEPKFGKAVTDLIKSENIGLLLNARGTVIHADNYYNITPKVTDALNKAGAADSSAGKTK